MHGDMSDKSNGKNAAPPPPDLWGWLGFRRFSEWCFERARPLGGLFGALLVLATVALIIIFFASLWDFFGAITGWYETPETFDMRAAGVLLAFLLGAPFVIWRTMAAAKQAETAAESLFNDKLNAASQALAARRQVTRPVMVNGEERILTEWEDDILTRSAAIDRLEGLVRERPDVADRVASMLSVYVRELSKECPAKTIHEKATLDDIHVFDIEMEVYRPHPFRSDVEKAAQVLGRIQKITGVQLNTFIIDLRGANLEGFDLRGLTYNNARFNNAFFRGTNLSDSNLAYSDLSGVELGRGRSLVIMEDANIFAIKVNVYS